MREVEGERIQNVLHKCMKLSNNKFNNKRGGELGKWLSKPEDLSPIP